VTVSLHAHGSTQIALAGLRVRGFHGVLPEEREQGQDFLVDVSLSVPSPETDDLERTVDYGALAQRLADVVAGEPVDLIETLAARLMDVCLAEPLVENATVRVHKPEAPVGLPFKDVSVTLQRPRSRGPRQASVLSLGSNVGDRLGHLQAAVTLLASVATVWVSPVYETDPVGGPEQDPYLNAVVATSLHQPRELHRFTLAVEASRDRERSVRWSPRTLDIDLITVNQQRQDTPDLTLPHPRAAERAFVLVPWLDVDPDARLPQGRVADLVAAMDTAGVRRTDLELST
jgi:dihydroneopterin aldolase/2-amino-4-hydroxy-6-hydroxymethyldihydropteridine diphosphokinase